MDKLGLQSLRTSESQKRGASVSCQRANVAIQRQIRKDVKVLTHYSRVLICCPGRPSRPPCAADFFCERRGQTCHSAEIQLAGSEPESAENMLDWFLWNDDWVCRVHLDSGEPQIGSEECLQCESKS